MPCEYASVCNSQWPLDTHTAQTWFRSAKSSSKIMRRYFRSRSLSVLTSMPSETFVVQAGSSFGMPVTSTMHRRHAPMS